MADQPTKPTNVNVDKRAISGQEMRMDRAFSAMRADAQVQNSLTQDTVREKMASAIRDAAPLIAGMGLLQQTDSPALAIGGAYLTDKIKDQMEARAARKKAEKDEMKQRRMAAQIAVRQGKFQSEEEAMQSIADNRLAQEETRIAEEQQALLEKMGIAEAEAGTQEKEAENADKEGELLDQRAENIAKETAMLQSPDTAEGVERAEPGSRAEMTEALRQLTDTQREALGVGVQGSDNAIVDGETGRPLSNKAMEDALFQHQENLSAIDQNIGHLVDIQTNAAMDANKDRLAAQESAREAARGGAPAAAAGSGGGDGGDDEEGGGGLFSRFGKNRKSRKSGGSKKPQKGGGKGGIGGTLGKLVGGFAGGAIAAFVQALGNPMMAKAAAIFAVVAPLVGVGIGGFIAAISAGIAAASWIMGKALPTLADGMSKLSPAIKTFESLDGNKLSAAASGMGDLLKGLSAVGIGGLVSELANTDKLEDLAYAIQEFESIDGEKLKLIGPAMISLGKGMGATGLGAVAGALGEFFSGGSPKDQYKDLAEGLNHFNTVDTQKLQTVGPAVEALGTGLAGMGAGKLKGALGGLANAFGSLFGAKDDPIANIKRFAAELGEQELSNQLTVAGQGIRNLGEGLSSFKGAKVPEDLDKMIDPLTKVFTAVGKMGPDAGIQFQKTMKGFHLMKGLEKVDFATLGPGFTKLGDGLEDFVDYVRDDDGPKVISEAGEAIAKFSDAMGKFGVAKSKLAMAEGIKMDFKAKAASREAHAAAGGKFIGGEAFRPGGALSPNQHAAVTMGLSMGNKYGPEVMAAFEKREAMNQRLASMKNTGAGRDDGNRLNERAGGLTLANGGLRTEADGTIVVNNNNNSQQNTTNNQAGQDVRTRSNESTLAKKAWRSTHLNFAS